METSNLDAPFITFRVFFVQNCNDLVSEYEYDGWTPLHSAAKNGHLKNCEYITFNIENKNPGRNDGYYHSNMHVSI